MNFHSSFLLLADNYWTNFLLFLNCITFHRAINCDIIIWIILVTKCFNSATLHCKCRYGDVADNIALVTLILWL